MFETLLKDGTPEAQDAHRRDVHLPEAQKFEAVLARKRAERQKKPRASRQDMGLTSRVTTSLKRSSMSSQEVKYGVIWTKAQFDEWKPHYGDKFAKWDESEVKHWGKGSKRVHGCRLDNLYVVSNVTVATGEHAEACQVPPS